KTKLQAKAAADDPVKKVALLHEIVETIARIPDPIMRGEYISQCSRIGNVSEHVLIGELNKELRKKYKRTSGEEQPALKRHEEMVLWQGVFEEDDADAQERDIIRLLLNYHSHQISFPKNKTIEATDGTTEWISVPVAAYIIEDLDRDEISFGNNFFSLIYSEL